MLDVKAIKQISHFNDCVIIRYKVFVPSLIFSFDLIDDQFWVTISLKVSYPYFVSELETNE